MEKKDESIRLFVFIAATAVQAEGLCSFGYVAKPEDRPPGSQMMDCQQLKPKKKMRNTVRPTVYNIGTRQRAQAVVLRCVARPISALRELSTQPRLVAFRVKQISVGLTKTFQQVFPQGIQDRNLG